ncbi:MAG: AMP-binding protein [Nitrospiria bacterium]
MMKKNVRKDRNIDEIIWTPSEKMISNSNVWRLMKHHHLRTHEELMAWSISDIGRFWDAVMRDLSIEWETPYHTIYDSSAGVPWTKWFIGGKTNIVSNCIDRHVEKRANEIAILFEREDKTCRSMTYEVLHQEVSRLALALKREGIGLGDTVGIYMPMSIEMVITFYATLKIGAISLPVFSGFASEALAARLAHADTKILFTADGCERRGKQIEIKRSVDQAAAHLPLLRRVVCLNYLGNKIQWNRHRDCWYHDFIAGPPGQIHTQAVDAEAPGIILYTSGTTGPPKGTVHSHGGCVAQVGKELAYHFDVKASDRFFWLTDIGWMMGPWMLMGVHIQGGAVFLYDGAPNYSEYDRLWALVDRHKITHFGISPTAIRVLMRGDGEGVKKYSFRSLRILGSTGEPWDDESYRWFFNKIGRAKLPVINISGGTEIIGCFLAPLPISPLKTCSLQGAALGMDVDVFDAAGKPVRGKRGYLVCKQAAPSMTRGFWKDRDRYLSTYWSRWPDIWFHGDWARIDNDGYWFLEGRSDDTINIAGRRVGPSEIESIIISHADVSEAAVIGIPDRIKGAALVVFVVPGRKRCPDLQALKNEVVNKMGKAFLPKSIHVVSSLPCVVGLLQ